QTPLHDVDHLMEMETFVLCRRSRKKIRIDIRNAVVDASLKALETRKADRRQRWHGNMIDNDKLGHLNLFFAEIERKPLEVFRNNRLGQPRVGQQRLLNPAHNLRKGSFKLLWCHA